MDITMYFTDLASLAALAVIVTGYATKSLGLKDLPAQILSWVVAILLVVIGKVFAIPGAVADLAWIEVALYGLAVGLVSNGLFDVPVVKTLLTFIRAKLPKK